MKRAETERYDLYLEAPAKINLILRVLGRRKDGYHELQTWMQKVSLYDIIRVKVLDSPGIELHCDKSGVAADSSNLVWRAAALFFSESQRGAGYGASLSLEKNVPVSAGLGGGSSDAGAVLKGLNSYFNNEFSAEELIGMGQSLGADVPFFTTDMDSVLATGIGEKMVQVAPLKKCIIVLINPEIFVSTAWVFRKFALTRGKKNFKLCGSRTLDTGELSLHHLENDLEEVTVYHYPVIEKMKTQLKGLGAQEVLMSGSGPTVFGIFPQSLKNEKNEFQGIIEKLRRKFGEKVFVVEPRGGV